MEYPGNDQKTQRVSKGAASVVIVTNQTAPRVHLRPAGNENPNPTPPEEQEPVEDEFKATSPNKHAGMYDATLAATSLAALAVKGGAKVGQFAFLGNQALGTPSFNGASSIALVGGTLDVVVGASKAMNSAVNRNLGATVSGSLQVLSGVSTYVAVAASAFGAPGIVGQAASWVSAGAFVGRLGMDAVAGLRARGAADEGNDGDNSGGGGAAQSSVLSNSFPTGSAGGLSVMSQQPFGSMAAVKKPMDEGDPDDVNPDSRVFENLFAASRSINQFSSQISGLGAFWNNIDSIRGNAPGKFWGPLGVVGATYSLAGGLASMKSGAANRHGSTVIQGALQTVQGVATVGASMGIGGRLSGIVAVGSAIGRYGVMMYEQSKMLGGDEEGDDEEGKTKGVLGQVAENIGSVFSSSPEIKTR